MSSPAEARIAIVGTGIAGLALAFRLVQKGYKPTLIRSSTENSCASHCAQGVVANKGLIFFESPLFAAKLKSLAHVQTWLDEIERVSNRRIDRDFSGIFEPYWDSEDFSKVASRIYRHRFWGCHGTKNLKSIASPFPFATKSPLGYLFYPQDGWFNVAQTLVALEEFLLQNGARFLEQEIKILKFSSSGTISVFGNGWDESFDRVILASGAGTGSLLQSSGIALPKMFTIGGQTLALRITKRSDKPLSAVRQTFSGTWSGQDVFIGSSSWKGIGISEEGLKEDRDLLMGTIESQLGWNLKPWLENAKSRVGARLRFADRMPAVGTLPAEPWRNRLYLMTGFYKSALQLADICAQDLSNILDDSGVERQFPSFDSLRLFKN